MSDEDRFYEEAVGRLQHDARLGGDLEHFERSAAGRYLLACADRDAMKAAQELVDCDPMDAKRIAHLQGEVKRAANLREWITAAVNRGKQALATLTEVDE